MKEGIGKERLIMWRVSLEEILKNPFIKINQI